MMLADWITANNLTMTAAARLFGIEGINPGATLARLAKGERQPDADMVERIARLTGGAVDAAAMHAVRLAWLKANRPEKFPGEGEAA